MSKLYFKVASDWQEVVRLRNEIAKLETQIKAMDANKAPQAVAVLNHQMQQTKQQMQGMITEAAKAGAAMDNDFKSKIYQSSQSVNDFTQKIINQKSAIKGFEQDLRALQEEYRKIAKNGGKSQGGLDRIHRMKNIIAEEKDALFNLTQEQANARLSAKKLRDEYALYKDEGKGVVNTTDSIGISLKKAFAIIGGAAAIKQLGSEIIRVRGEFQSMQTAIETLVGKDMAGNLIPQIKELAKISPLTLTDMVGAEKMMLGFNIKAEDTIRYLQALGDISMGNSQKFNSLTLAFSQMSATGKLMGQDLNQMINAGFNPLQQIAQSTGKSISTLKEEMSKGAISTEMVQKAFIDATSAGGKFFGMSENASKTINGQLSMMQDALDEVFNEIGTKGEGAIMSGIQATTSLIQNYETVGKIISGLVVTYGAYRTAVMLSTIATGKHTIAEVALTNVRVIARRAQMALNASMLTNPYVLLTTVVVGAAVAMWALHDGTTAAEKAQESYNKKVEDAAQKAQDHKQKLERLISELQNEVTAETRKMEILDEIKKGYPSLFQKFIDEKGHIKDLTEGWKAYNEEASKNKAIQNKSNVSGTKTNLQEYRKMVSLWDKYGEDPNFHKNELSVEEATLASKYSNETLGRLKNKIEAGERELSLYEKDVRKDNFNQWKVDLTKQTDKQIEATRGALVKRAQAANGDKTRLATIGKYIIAIDEEKNVRKANSVTYGTDFKAAKIEWETAKKEFDAIEKDKDKYTITQYDNAKKREETAEKAYKDLGGVTNTSKQESAAEKLRKQNEKSAEELLSLRRKNQQDEIDLIDEGTEKKIKQIELDYQKETDAIKKQEKEFTKDNGGKMTSEQSSQISTAYTNAENDRIKGIAEANKAELEAMRDYLKEYGTFQQQKLAIAEEYAEKISKAQTEGDRLKLEKERDSAIQNKEIEVIKQNIDWQGVFGNLTGMLDSQLKETLSGLKEYVKTDKFKSSSETDMKTVYDAIEQLQSITPDGEGTLNFNKIQQQMDELGAAINRLQTATLNQEIAYEKSRKAQEDYDNALKSGDKGDIDSAKQALDLAKLSANAASDAYAIAEVDVQNFGNNLRSTSEDTVDGLNLVASGLQNFANGSLPEIFRGLQNTVAGLSKINIGGEVGNAIGTLSKTLSSAGVIGQIISAVLSIIDILKDGIGTLISGIIDSILGAVDGILSNILSGDLFVQIFSSLKDGIGNILNTITFGGFNSLFGIGGNAKEIGESIDRLNDRNEHLQNAIESLTDEMKSGKGTKSVEAYREAYNYQKEQDANRLNIAQEQARYSGSHHSWQYYMGWSAEDIKWVQDNVNNSFTGTSSLWGLTPEEMEKLRSNVDIWTKMQDAGKGGYGGRVTDKLDDYIDQAGKLEELTDMLYEGLTGISFDSMYDSFISNLMDMKYDAKAASEDISEYFMRAMLSNKIGEMYSEKLEGWWNKFGESMKDNNLTKDERNALQEEYMKYVEEAMKLRDELAAATGYDEISQESSSQSSTKGMSQSMDQDTGNELNGRFTAFQISNEEIKNQSVLQSQSLNLLTFKADALLTVNTEVRNIADETRTLIANSYLELQEIRENTGAIIKPIKDMAKDMAEVKRNTAGLAT